MKTYGLPEALHVENLALFPAIRLYNPSRIKAGIMMKAYSNRNG